MASFESRLALREDTGRRYALAIAKSAPAWLRAQWGDIRQEASRIVQVGAMITEQQPALMGLFDSEEGAKSFWGAVRVIVSSGLDPAPQLNLASVVGFGGKAQVIFGYPGLIEMATRDEGLQGIRGVNVFANEHFVYEEGTSPRIEHRPALDPEKRGDYIGSYAVADFTGGGTQAWFMPASAIKKIRDKAIQRARGKFTPWQDEDNFYEMARKTPVRALVKYLPKRMQNTALLRAAQLDSMADEGIDQQLHTEPLPSEAVDAQVVSDAQIKALRSYRSQILATGEMDFAGFQHWVAEILGDDAPAYPSLPEKDGTNERDSARYKAEADYYQDALTYDQCKALHQRFRRYLGLADK